jgi:hypothetical protein
LLYEPLIFIFIFIIQFFLGSVAHANDEPNLKIWAVSPFFLESQLSQRRDEASLFWNLFLKTGALTVKEGI